MCAKYFPGFSKALAFIDKELHVLDDNHRNSEIKTLIRTI
jgi:hypothetical protein